MENESKMTKADEDEMDEMMDQAFDAGSEAFGVMTDFLSEKSDDMVLSAYHVWMRLTEVLTDDGWTVEQLTNGVVDAASANNADGKHLLN